MSNPIDLYLATSLYETLALSTSPDDSPDSVHIASYGCGEIYDLEEEGRTFEDWVKEDFVKNLDEYLGILWDSLLYGYAADTRVYNWLNERGFSLPVLRYDKDMYWRQPDGTGVPYRANDSRDYARQVDRLFDLTLLFDKEGNPFVRLERRRPTLCRFIAVDDQCNLPYWLIQQWDWVAEDWAKHGIVRSEVYGEPLEPHRLQVPEDGNPEGITHRLSGLRARELEEALDGLSLNGTKHLVSPYLRYIGNGAQCGLNLNHPSTVYEGEIRHL